ncbi:MAG: ABC transporter permease [Chitinivibrionia bacterium]|nr:ABC transporter permease [Chitinivibrionia bacterium]
MDFLTIFNYELKSLVKSTKSTVLSLAIVSLFWGIFFSLNIFSNDGSGFALVWLLFFALLASAGFAGISFVRERLSGSWEILIASGIERKTIFLAKFIFAQTASFIWGAATLLIAVSAAVFLWDFSVEVSLIFILAVFFFAALSVNAITAYFTIINVNPRAIQLMNFAVMTLLSMMIFAIDSTNLAGKATILAILSAPAVLLLLLVPKALYDDRIVQKVVY